MFMYRRAVLVAEERVTQIKSEIKHINIFIILLTSDE